MEYLLLVVGFIVIIFASNVLVDASSSIAIKYKLPKSLIALTIVAFGTCAPELAISFTSISSNNGSVALANVIGSSIINISLIIGIAAIVHPIRIKSQTVNKELPILLIITTVFCGILYMRFSSMVDYIRRIDGLILVLLFGVFVWYIFGIARSKSKIKNEEVAKYNPQLSIVYILITIVAIVFSSNLIVDNSIIIANNLGVSQKVITMIAIVIGTSLPELVLTVTSAKKGEFEFAVGNIIGTNIFNICIVFGLPTLLMGGFKIIDFNLIDILIVAVSTLMLFVFSKSGKKLTRVEGIIMLFIFIAYYTYLIVH